LYRPVAWCRQKEVWQTVQEERGERRDVRFERGRFRYTLLRLSHVAASENAMPRTDSLIRRRTKIVATVGPASREPAVLLELIRAGVNVFRLNFSHGSHDDHGENLRRIRAAAASLNEPVAVLGDLCGPKIRVGKFPGGQITLSDGQAVTITTRDVEGGPDLIPSQYAALARDVRPGDRILLDDGNLELRAESTDGVEIRAVVVHGGVLKQRKGMNLPGVLVSSPALTDKDRDDALFALKAGVDFLALSFVRRPWDVSDLKQVIASAGKSVPVIAKIEKPEAMDCIDEILDEADGLMVARGDLGVEMPPEAVPIVQRELIEKARLASKPVIVATQMLESMITNPRPTRAEVSDVSTAVFLGADAVMLSAETAAGDYPVAAVQMMDRVARQVEGWQWLDGAFRSITENEAELPCPLPMRLAVARSTAQLSRDLRVRSIFVRTRSGTSAAFVSCTRPAAPVVALTADDAMARRLNLFWGVVPRAVGAEEFGKPRVPARRLAVQEGLASEGDTILLLSGFGTNEPTVTVLPVGEQKGGKSEQ
jgi:pyruvate kinase